MPKLPSIERLLPRGAATTQLRDQGYDQALALAVYDQWLQRRRQTTKQGPLIAMYWFEEPWKSIGFEDPDEPGVAQGGMPFRSVPRPSPLRRSTVNVMSVTHPLLSSPHLSPLVHWRQREGMASTLALATDLPQHVGSVSMLKKPLTSLWV